MKPEEAIEILDEVKELDDSMYAYNPKYMNAVDMAIEALKEVQLYRLIKDVTIGEIAEVLKEFSKIGTVEECREAVEKQKQKKPKDELKINPVIDENGANVDADMTVYLLCPNCGEMVGIDENIDRFCSECVQAIDNDNLEGMEDEEN